MTDAVLIGHFEPGSAEWHAARAQGLGGSEIAPVLGLSPFESRFSLWHRKAGLAGPVEETPEMEWGKRLEPVILAKYREAHPELDYRVRNGTFSHPDRPWQIANPDLLATDRVIEVKAPLFADAWGEPGTDEIPVYYRCQVLWYLDVLGHQRADLAVLIGGHDYREYTVLYDEAEARLLRDAAVEFLASIAAGDRPDIDAHGHTYQVLRELHPLIEDVDVEVPNSVAVAYIEAKAAEKAAKTASQLATSLMAEEMGLARRAVWDGRTIARRQAKGDSLPYVVAERGLDDLLPTEVTP